MNHAFIFCVSLTRVRPSFNFKCDECRPNSNPLLSMLKPLKSSLPRNKAARVWVACICGSTSASNSSGWQSSSTWLSLDIIVMLCQIAMTMVGRCSRAHSQNLSGQLASCGCFYFAGKSHCRSHIPFCIMYSRAGGAQEGEGCAQAGRCEGGVR